MKEREVIRGEMELEYLYEILSGKRKADKKLGFLIDRIFYNPHAENKLIQYSRGGYQFTLEITHVEKEKS